MSYIDRLKLKAKLLAKAKKNAGKPMPLKDALNAVARLSGYDSWRELRKETVDPDLYAGPTGIFPNHWCKTHEEALGVQRKIGGYLLPYRKQFFVCTAEYLEGMGVSQNDPDLMEVGTDWTQPKNRDALKRLNAKIQEREK